MDSIAWMGSDVVDERMASSREGGAPPEEEVCSRSVFLLLMIQTMVLLEGGFDDGIDMAVT